MSENSTREAQGPERDGLPPLQKAVNSLAGTIGHREFPSGDLAALRNIKLDSSYPPAYWRLVTDPDKVPASLSKGEANEKRWAVLLQAMAIMAPKCHQPGAALGRVLAGMDRGTMESRLLRLLSSRGQVTWDQIRLLARMLDNQGKSIDFNDLAGLLFSPEGPEREKARRKIARDFFSAQPKKDKNQTSSNQ